MNRETGIDKKDSEGSLQMSLMAKANYTTNIRQLARAVVSASSLLRKIYPTMRWRLNNHLQLSTPTPGGEPGIGRVTTGGQQEGILRADVRAGVET